MYHAQPPNAKRPCLRDQTSTNIHDKFIKPVIFGEVQPHVDNHGVEWNTLWTHTCQDAVNEYYMEQNSRKNGKLAECGAVIAFNYELLNNRVHDTLYVLQRTLPYDFSIHICQSAPLVDKDGTDVLRLKRLSCGTIVLDGRVQAKDLQKKSALHYNNLSYMLAAIFRISKRMNINMETEMGTFKKYISPNITIVTPDDASAPSKPTIDALQYFANALPGFENTKVSTRNFSWADVELGVEYINDWLQKQDNKPTPTQEKKVQDGRTKVQDDLKEMLKLYFMAFSPLVVPNVANPTQANPFTIFEEQFAIADLPPGLGKTRLAFKACMWMRAMAEDQNETNLQCMIVMGSNNVKQYTREAVLAGVKLSDIQIIKRRHEKIDPDKTIILLSPYVPITANFENVKLLFTIVDEAHKYHTANGANADRKTMYRSQLINILSKHTKYGMLMTGTPLHGQQFDENRMVRMSMKTAADMGIGMLPEIGVLVLPRHNGLRHRIFFRHVIAKRKQFLYDNAMIRVNNVKAAELMANRLENEDIPVCRYFDKYRQEFPTHDNHKIIIVVNACNGNVDIPSCRHVIDLDQMDPATCSLTQLMTRSCRIADRKLIARFTMVQFTDQSPADYVWEAVGGFACRAGVDVSKLPLYFVPLADIHVNNIIANYAVKSGGKQKSPSDDNPVVMPIFEEHENCTINNYTKIQAFVDKIANEIRTTENEKEQARLLAIELRKQQTLATKEKKQEAKQNKQTKQLSDLQQLELCAEKKEMPKQSVPQEHKLAMKWKNIRRRPDSSNYMLIMAEHTNYPCLKILLKQHDDKPKRGTKTPPGDFKVDIPALENALGDKVVSSAYKAHKKFSKDGQRVRGLLGYLCNNENAYPKQKTHTVYGRYADDLKVNSRVYKADRIYINAFKEHLPKSVRDVLQMDRWNDKGTLL